MIVLLESVHADALAMLEAVDTVRVMADPSTITSDVPRDEVRVMLTRGRGRITAATLDEFPAPASTTSTSARRPPVVWRS